MGIGTSGRQARARRAADPDVDDGGRRGRRSPNVEPRSGNAAGRVRSLPAKQRRDVQQLRRAGRRVAEDIPRGRPLIHSAP